MMIFKKLLGAICIIAAASICQAQSANKPKIIVFPAEEWCVKNGYTTDNGKLPDYNKALMDTDMDGAVAVLGDMMAEAGYEIFSLKQELKDIQTESAYNMVVTSKADGEIIESDRDLITRNVGADFIVELSINTKPFGVRRVVEAKVMSIDAASKKIIHGDLNTTQASSAPVPLLVKEAVGLFFDNFCHKMNLAFNRIETEGREGSVTFKIADDCPLNFESTVSIDGESGELADYITYLIEEQAVNGNCNLTQKSRETLRYDQIHFPLVSQVATGGFGSKKGKKKSQTMESFIKAAVSPLSRLNISISVVPIGQGKAYIVLGGL